MAANPSRAYGRALTRSMKYWAIWDELSEQGKGNSKEAIEAREKYLQAEDEMASICGDPKTYETNQGSEAEQ